MRHRKIVIVENDPLQRAVLVDLMRERFPQVIVEAPGSWEETANVLRADPDHTVVVTDGLLWGDKTATDMYTTLDATPRSGQPDEYVVLYSDRPERFPEFRNSIMKPQIGELVGTIQRIVS